ncbi:hypothetical protein JCM3774_006460 [Rhodotorula dairenensis]
MTVLSAREVSESPPAPPLLRLSTELLDRILSLSVPRPPKLARKRWAALLLVHPALVPIIRRALYRKVSLVVGDPRGSDQRLLRLLEQAGGPASEHVQYLRIRVPDPPQNVILHPGQDPAFALLPRPCLDPVKTLALVTRVITLVPHVRHIELNLQVGVNLEGQESMGEGGRSSPERTDSEAQREALRRLADSLQLWAPRLETCVSAVEDPRQRLQVWADRDSPVSSDPQRDGNEHPRSQLSPQVRALARWHNLSRLDLWRVRLVLPRPFLAGPHARPTFRLCELVLTQCELGGEPELEWLLGSRAPADAPRSSRLNKLVLDCVEFDDAPGSSAPVRTVFAAPAGPDMDYLVPFATTLECLTLAVELGGPGITEPILASLFGSLDSTLPTTAPGTKSAAPPPPSSGIRELLLGYLTSIRLPRLLAYLNPSNGRLASLSYSMHPLRDLDSLTFKTAWDLPRRWTWEQRQRTREPLWDQVHYNRDQLVAPDDPSGADVGGWETIEEAVKQLVRERTKLAHRSGIVASAEGRPPLRLFKNRLEYTYDDSDSDSGSEGSREHDDSDADGGNGRATRSASEMDPNALFEPSEYSGDDEDQNAWVRRRIEEEEDYESDF